MLHVIIFSYHAEQHCHRPLTPDDFQLFITIHLRPKRVTNAGATTCCHDVFWKVKQVLHIMAMSALCGVCHLYISLNKFKKRVIGRAWKRSSAFVFVTLYFVYSSNELSFSKRRRTQRCRSTFRTRLSSSLWRASSTMAVSAIPPILVNMWWPFRLKRLVYRKYGR